MHPRFSMFASQQHCLNNPCIQAAPSGPSAQVVAVALGVPLGIVLLLAITCGIGVVLSARYRRSSSSHHPFKHSSTTSSRGLGDGTIEVEAGSPSFVEHRSRASKLASRLLRPVRTFARALGLSASALARAASSGSASSLASLSSQLHGLRGRSASRQANKAPGVGPDTALLLTDVMVCVGLG